jgi:phosphatidyl-myo-inositol dimannoside synthase
LLRHVNPNSETHPTVVGLFTELLQAGGIQRYGRLTAAALHDLDVRGEINAEILSLNDPTGCSIFYLADQAYTVRGFGRRKASLFVYLLRRAWRIKTLYIGHPNLGPMGFLLRLVNPRLRYWVVAHGVEVWQPLPLHRRAALRSAQGVVAVSRHTAARLAEAQGVNRQKIVVLHNALDPGILVQGNRAQSLSTFHSSSKIILTVGRLDASEPGKGVDTVIRALPRVLTSVPNVYYLVVGKGDQSLDLQRLATCMGVSDRVHFAGGVSEADLMAYYDQADVFVMPSKQEGFGIAFLEAMAFGKPVVAGSHGGTSDVVEDGVTGFLVEHSDVLSIADRLVDLLSDEALRIQMGEAGRRRLQERFTFERYAIQLADLLLD